MDTNQKQPIQNDKIEKAPAANSSQVKVPGITEKGARSFMGRGGGARQKNPRRTSRRDARVKPEFDQKIINIRRVTRVVAGGKRFNFSVAIVVGNRKGSVGVGLGKGADTSLAIDKAVRDAKKRMIKVSMTKTMSIPHETKAKFSSARVLLMPAAGRGVIAGSSVRTVLELAGVKDVVAKLLSGTKNTTNNAQAAIQALSSLSEPRSNDKLEENAKLQASSKGKPTEQINPKYQKF